MTRKKNNRSKVNFKPAQTAEEVNLRPKSTTIFLQTTWGRVFPYLLIFLGTFTFSTFTYGDVFTRCAEENFVSSDPELMKHLTDTTYGSLYIFGRYLLLMFHQKWIGGLLFSFLLTAIAFLFDYIFRTPKWLRGVGTIVPTAFLTYWVNEGLNIYYKSEPSLFLIQAVGIFLVLGMLAILSKTILSKFFPRTAIVAPEGWRRWSVGTFIALLTMLPLNMLTSKLAENTILTASMQNHLLEDDMVTLVEDGLSAKQPTRSVAAYYAIGLLQTDQLLEHVFDISYHFPKTSLSSNDGSGEYGIFTADCNFYAGLINSAYRSAMDQIVMSGPRLYYLKRMALCAILNQEKELAEKYLSMISEMPFEKDFVEKYRPLLEDPEKISAYPSLSRVMALYPTEQRFEQNYRNPAFLGYNIGMLQGSNAALAPSIAACMYSKDLPNMALRAYQYKLMTGSVPLSVQEALSIHARKQPDVYKYFPELNEAHLGLPNPANTNVNNFYLSIQKLFKEKYGNVEDWRIRMAKDLRNGISEEMREQISRDWKGHYVYYYYCENINQQQQTTNKNSGSVN